MRREATRERSGGVHQVVDKNIYQENDEKVRSVQEIQKGMLNRQEQKKKKLN